MLSCKFPSFNSRAFAMGNSQFYQPSWLEIWKYKTSNCVEDAIDRRDSNNLMSFMRQPQVHDPHISRRGLFREFTNPTTTSTTFPAMWPTIRGFVYGSETMITWKNEFSVRIWSHKLAIVVGVETNDFGNATISIPNFTVVPLTLTDMANKQVALIVGASRGIGRQVAIDLAKCV